MSPEQGPAFRVRDHHAVEVNGRHYRMVIDSAAIVEAGDAPRKILDTVNGHGPFTADPVVGALEGQLPPHAVNAALVECVAMDLIEPVDAANGNGNGNGNGHGASGPDGALIPTIATSPPEMPAGPPTGLGRMGSLTLHVAHTCNMKCGYCYADAGLYGGDPGLMTKETAREYVDRLFATSGDVPALSIQFFGGEPLLNYPVIQDATEYALGLARENKKPIRFGMTTNGLLLDEEKAGYLASRGFTITVSIDGPKETNDALRSTSAGAPTYDRIVATLPLLRKFPKAAARVTVTRQDLDVDRIVTHLVEAGFPEVGVTNVTTDDPEYALREEDYDTLLDGFRKLTDHFVEEARAGRVFPFSNIRNVLAQVHEGASRTHPCGAGIRLFAGTPDGGLYLCHRFAGTEEFRMGTVADGIDTESQAALLRDLDVREKPECSNCWLRTLCAGGCHHVSHENAGDACGVDASLCPWLREWFHIGLETYIKLAQETPEFLSKLLGETEDCFQA